MSTKRFLLIALLLMATALTAACASGSPPASADLFSLPRNASGYIDISADQLETALSNKDFTLVNVHIPYAGEIPRTDAFIPFDEIEANLSQLPADKTAKIIVYCRSGSMSAQASQTLAQLGYTNVADVNGGMNAWQSAGNSLLTR